MRSDPTTLRDVLAAAEQQHRHCPLDEPEHDFDVHIPPDTRALLDAVLADPQAAKDGLALARLEAHIPSDVLIGLSGPYGPDATGRYLLRLGHPDRTLDTLTHGHTIEAAVNAALEDEA